MIRWWLRQSKKLCGRVHAIARELRRPCPIPWLRCGSIRTRSKASQLCVKLLTGCSCELPPVPCLRALRSLVLRAAADRRLSNVHASASSLYRAPVAPPTGFLRSSRTAFAHSDPMPPLSTVANRGILTGLSAHKSFLLLPVIFAAYNGAHVS